MAAPLIIFKMLDDMKKERIHQNICLIKNEIQNEKVIKINLLIKEDILRGLIIITDCHIYNYKVDIDSIIPIVKYYGLYTREFKQEFDNYNSECCVLF